MIFIKLCGFFFSHTFSYKSRARYEQLLQSSMMYGAAIIFVVFLTFGINCQDDKEKLTRVIDECSKKFPSVDATIFKQECAKTSDKDARCMSKCIGEQFEVVSSDGKLMVDKIKSTSELKDPAKVNQLNEALDKCSVLVEADACDTAYNQWQCLCEFYKS